MKARMLSAAMVGLVLLGGCVPETGPTESPSPTITTPSSPTPLPSPTESPSPTAPSSFPPPPEGEDPEIAEIREAWEAYEKLMLRYYTDPEFNDLDALNDVAAGEEIHRATQVVLEWRNRNLVTQGDRIVRDVEISSPSVDANGRTLAIVRFCADPTSTTTVDLKTGEIVAQPSQTLTSWVTMELLENERWQAALYQSEVAVC